MRTIRAFIALLLCTSTAVAGSIDDLPLFAPENAAYEGDWLLRPPEQKARVYRTENKNEIVLANGLISRTQPGAVGSRAMA